MSKWIRWKGLIPFVAICAAIVLFLVVFIDGIVAGIISSTGSKIAGAKVETGNVDVHFSPLGIDIQDLQIADAKSPMSNAVEIKHIGFGLDGGRLLLGKLIIDDMNMDGVRFNTPRKTSGALPVKATRSASTGSPTPNSATSNKDNKVLGMDMPSLDLPDIDTILKKEPLHTQEIADQLQQNVKSTLEHWDQLKQTLPSDSKVAEYQARLDKIRRTDTNNTQQLLVAIADTKKLQQDVQQDLNQVQQVRTKVSQDLAEVDQNYRALLKAPAEDQKRLVEKYTPNSKGIGNISKLLFGAKAEEWTQRGLYWYKKIAPDNQAPSPPKPKRFEGVDIAFHEYHPTPGFLIRQIHAAVETSKGQFQGQVHDVTNDPEILGKPMRFDFTGRNMSGMNSLDLHGRFDHVNPKQTLDTVNMDIEGYKVSGRNLTEAPGLRLRMASALSNTQLRATRTNGKLGGNMNIHLRDIKYDNKSNGGDFQTLLVDAFDKISDFNIDTRLSGTLGQPGLSISSDLDKRLNSQINKAFDRRLAAYRNSLDQAIKQATEAPLKQARDQVNDLHKNIDSQIAAVQQRLDAQKTAFNQAVAQFQGKLSKQKQNAQKALEDKAKALLNQLQR